MSRLHDFVARYVPDARRCGDGFAFSCPLDGHGRGRGDRNRSVSASEATDGRVLIHCHAGCRTEDILAALGASWSELQPDGAQPTVNRLCPARSPEPQGSLRVDLGLCHDPGIPRLAASAVARASGWPLEELSKDTGPSVASYERLRTGYLTGDLALRASLEEGSTAYSFPMYLPDGPVCGIRVRSCGGRKWAVRGSRNGLFIPEGVDLVRDRLVICEGPTDTAALLDLGFPAIGRASATSGVELCAVVAEKNTYGEVVVVCDNDGPGRAGAVQCCEVLARYSTRVLMVAPPPDHKDVRDWLLAGAEHGDLEALISAAAGRGALAPVETKGVRHA